MNKALCFLCNCDWLSDFLCKCHSTLMTVLSNKCNYKGKQELNLEKYCMQKLHHFDLQCKSPQISDTPQNTDKVSKGLCFTSCASCKQKTFTLFLSFLLTFHIIELNNEHLFLWLYCLFSFSWSSTRKGKVIMLNLAQSSDKEMELRALLWLHL